MRPLIAPPAQAMMMAPPITLTAGSGRRRKAAPASAPADSNANRTQEVRRARGGSGRSRMAAEIAIRDVRSEVMKSVVSVSSAAAATEPSKELGSTASCVGVPSGPVI